MRVVSLLPAATEMLFLAGAGPRVVGVSHECNFPPAANHLPRLTRSRVDSSAPSAQIDEQVRTLISQGEPLYELDVERLAELQPDLIVTQAQCDVCALPESVVRQAALADPRLTSARVLAHNPTSVGEVLDDLVRVGTAAGVAATAQQARGELERRLDRVRAAGEQRAERRRVVVVEWLEPPMVASNWTPELVTLAGGVCPLGHAGRPSEYVTWNDIAAAEPDVVIVALCGFDLARTLSELQGFAPPISGEPFRSLDRSDVFAVDGDVHFNRPGPRLVDSAELIAEILLGIVDLTRREDLARVQW